MMPNSENQSGQTLIEATLAVTLLAVAISIVAKLSCLLWFHLNTKFLLRENLVCELSSTHSKLYCRQQLDRKMKTLGVLKNISANHSSAKQSVKITGNFNKLKYNYTEKFDGP